VGAGPLPRPGVDLAFGAVGPRHRDRDRDRLTVVAEGVTVVLAAPLVGLVLDGLTVHPPRVEQCSNASRGVGCELSGEARRNESRRTRTAPGVHAALTPATFPSGGDLLADNLNFVDLPRRTD
jgi:hypothetical protein